MVAEDYWEGFDDPARAALVVAEAAEGGWDWEG